jgi:hypothetical protein
MAGIVRGDVEILIHKTAPSRGPDDARYRALAQAYLDFKPASRRRLQEGEVVENAGMNADSQLQEELLRSTQEERVQSIISARGRRGGDPGFRDIFRIQFYKSIWSWSWTSDRISGFIIQ